MWVYVYCEWDFKNSPNGMKQFQGELQIELTAWTKWKRNYLLIGYVWFFKVIFFFLITT